MEAAAQAATMSASGASEAEVQQPTAVPVPSTQPSEPKLADKYNELSQREKQTFQRIKQLKQQEQQLQLRAQQIEEMYKKAQEFEQAKKQARLNPEKYLQMADISAEDLYNFKQNNNNPSLEARLQDMEQRFEEKLRLREEMEQKQRQEMQTKRQQAEAKAIKDYEASIETFVEQNASEFKFVKAYGGQSLILETAMEHAKRTGKVIDMKEAAQLAENYLREEWKKGQALMAENQEQAESPRQASKTISNDMVAAPQTNSPYLSPKTDDERMKRALAKLV